ncbi:MAG: hypothetical protein A3G05_00960 [Candidatus Zambryskibacteria bacterium RIFCSPLOWO2_12_FULL_45_14]|uniref:Uncharacterized protein n=2 Tax=Candidatus Zambryskiibacteriota TaxID=1817925 RepID=A0A1G2UMU7_9BACT|nr:MAG: hypothetical protein A3H60_00875 [Candidatus Zambryskibacteria bacterium RIFCSPLOWO2_02_FULL_44_12b]OHB13635.1 MAG: hypothetical protein A3G05_00960 [Candidatus Zambryskibacteria bacterium RIFCSPLOWO2_12_FULL_45_14]
MNIKKLSTFLVSFSLLFIVGVVSVYATQHGGGTNPPQGGGTSIPVNITLDNPFKQGVGNSLFTLMKAIVDNIILPVGGVLAVLAFIYSGFLYVTASGNDTKLKTAHKSLLYTAIGTAVLLGSWLLANVICSTINQLGGPVCQS